MKRHGIAVAVALSVGLFIGVSVTPSGAHVTNKFSHLWNKHIRPTLDREGYTPVVGSFATEGSEGHKQLSGEGTLVANLSQNGSGYLEIPFRARVTANGSVVLASNATVPSYLECRLNIYPPAGRYMSFPHDLVIDPGRTDTIPLVGSADVEPGTYDIGISCSGGDDTRSLNAAANVMAVRI